jgi:hypothetical protein
MYLVLPLHTAKKTGVNSWHMFCVADNILEDYKHSYSVVLRINHYIGGVTGTVSRVQYLYVYTANCGLIRQHP